MNDPDPRVEATRLAVECLTLWMESPRTEDKLQHIATINAEQGQTLVTGLLNLSAFLAYNAAKLAGATDEQEITERARRIVSYISTNQAPYAGDLDPPPGD